MRPLGKWRLWSNAMAAAAFLDRLKALFVIRLRVDVDALLCDSPVIEDVCNRLLLLPFYTGMTQTDQTTVVTATQEFSCWLG